MSILRSLPRLVDTGLIGSVEERETIWEKAPVSPPPPSILPIFSVLVKSKVFALVLLGRDDLEVIVMKSCHIREALFI